MEHLNFTPTAHDILVFEADLAVVSPSLMRAALAEIRDTNPIHSGKVKDWREAIYRVYNRKVAEQSQLFPVFHCFETAFRSTTAVALENLYGVPKWWEPLKQALQRGHELKSIKQINGVPITADVAITIGYLVGDLIQKKVNLVAITSGYELFEETDLARVGALINYHWKEFGPRFISNGIQLTRDRFMAKFNRVREIRNSVYHHKSVSGLKDAYLTAEELLAYLNFPLARVHQRIHYSPYPAMEYAWPIR